MTTGRRVGRVWARAWGIVALALALLVAGCGGGGNAAEPTPTPPPPTATPTQPPQPIALGQVVWATGVDASGAPQGQTDVIPYDAPAIVAAVETGALPAGSRLSAKWTMNGVAVPLDASATTVQADRARGAGWVTFQLVRHQGATWPPGELAVTVTASDGGAVSGTITIQVNQ